MARLQWLIDQSRWQFPLLYGDDQYTIWRILNQLFFVLGNGMEWTDDGEMADLFEDEGKPTMSQEEHDADLRQWYWSRNITKSLNRLTDKTERPMLLYPVFSSALISNVPDNVAVDFLVAGLLLLDFAITAPLEFFIDSERDMDGTTGYSAIGQRAKLTELREVYKERFKDRLKGLSWKTIYER